MIKRIRNAEEIFLVFTLVIMVVLIFYQVIGRYLFNSAPSWTEELARYIHIWQVWIGASYAIRLNRHLRIEAFVNMLPRLSRKAVETLALLIWFVFALVLAVLATQFIVDSIRYGQTSPAILIPMWIPYLAIPLGTIGMVFRLVEQIWLLWKPAVNDLSEGSGIN